MCRVMTHRGPDEEGFYLSKNIGLGSRRLSIIDLKTGKQPIHNEDQSIWIVYDGEVYNFPELRKDLEKKGHRFYTRTDTEVLIHLYEELGDSFVEKLNGMFAFALWDDNKKRLLLARDKAGIKPLHYTQLDGETFLFASEIKSILQYQKVKRGVDIQSLHYFLNLRYVPRERTMFRGIRRLLPAHLMIVEGDRVKTKRYWAPKIRPTNKPEGYYVKKLRKLLKESVARHMISDVPVGVWLSGGLDSSSVLALAAQVKGEPLDTFCMGFGMPTDETDDARFVADYYGANHRELVKRSNLLKEFPRMIWHADEPKRNLYPYYVSRLISRYVNVAQSGLGGDEIFGGYVFKYNFVSWIEGLRRRMHHWRRNISDAARKVVNFQATFGNMVDDEYLDYLETIQSINDNTALYLVIQTWDKVFSEGYLRKIYSSRLLGKKLEPMRKVFEPYFNNNLKFINQVFLADFSVKMPDDFLFVDDRMSMAHSVETRSPLLDDELIEFSFTIPVHLKLKDPNGKYLLKRAMQPYLPERILKKEKWGFTMDIYETYLRELREYATQKLPEGDLVKEGYIKKSYIEKVLGELPNPRLSLHYGVIWNLLAFEVWHEIYIKGNVKKPSLNINKMY